VAPVQPPSPLQSTITAVWDWLAHTVDWGNAQELITWVVAGVALVYAAKAAAAAHRTDVRQAEQLQELANDKHRAQAEKVAAWHEWVTEPHVGPMRFLAAYHAFAIRNASDVPIYSAWVAASGRERKDLNVSVGYLDVVPPGIQHLPMDYVGNRSEITDLRPRVHIFFRDAASRYWVRHLNGILEEQDEETWIYETAALRARSDEISDAMKKSTAPERDQFGDPIA
jgi:hypothetical protein